MSSAVQTNDLCGQSEAINSWQKAQRHNVVVFQQRERAFTRCLEMSVNSVDDINEVVSRTRRFLEDNIDSHLIVEIWGRIS